jgi:hypothetical protein
VEYDLSKFTLENLQKLMTQNCDTKKVPKITLKKIINNFSLFNAKFTLDNVPYKVEYNLLKFTLENLQKLMTQNCDTKKVPKITLKKE